MLKDTLTIRLNTFETNSSSAHTFVVGDKNTWTTDAEIDEYLTSAKLKNKFLRDGEIPSLYLVDDACEFGRGFSILGKWYEKMTYLFAALKYNTNIIEALKRRIKNFKCVVFPDERDDLWIDDEKTIDKSFPLLESEYTSFSYLGSVDHQSSDVADHIIAAMRKSKKYKDAPEVDIIYDIIFCNSFAIITDSDEQCTFQDLFERGFFRVNSFKYILHENYQYRSGNSSYDPFFMEIGDYYSDNEEDLSKYKGKDIFDI